MKKIYLLLLLAALTLVAGTVSGWGVFGHRTITQVAVYELPSAMQGFYFRHLPEIVRLSTTADDRRIDDPNEASKHFIDLDHYSEINPFSKIPKEYNRAVGKFTVDSLRKYGTLPWVIITTQAGLTDAFQQHDTLKIIRYSADLSHYIGDAYVPLHTTINYDGQLTDQKGLHDLWEGQLPERYINDYKLNGEPAKYLKDPLITVWTVLQQSFGFLDETFDRASKIDKRMKPEVRFTFTHRYGQTTRRYSDAFAAEYEKAVGGMVSFRLKAAPTMVASFWLTAWQDAGKPDLGNMMRPSKTTRDEKEKLANELAAWKSNTLSQDHLLLAQQKMKKVESNDQIRSAKAMDDSPAETADNYLAPTPNDPAPTPAPVKPKSKNPSPATKK